MKRLTMEALEALAFARHRPIELDYLQGIAVVEVGARTYYAHIPADVKGEQDSAWQTYATNVARVTA